MDEIIILEPCRNLIAFSNFADIDYNICNSSLKLILKHILKVILKLELELEHIPKDIKHFAGCGKHKFEIRANDFNWSLRLCTQSEPLIAGIRQYCMTDGKCCYLEINKIIHKDGKFHDILELDYHPLSFRQPDDNIRHTIITYFQKEYNQLQQVANTFIYIGGECTLFGRIFSKIFNKVFSDRFENHSRDYFITDFQSIYDDLKYNYSNSENSNSENIMLIDYKTCSLEWEKYSGGMGMCIIANTGYQGLGINLSQELTRSGSDVIYIISCNETSFQKDFTILETHYFIKRKIEIKTNYSVWIYKLILQTN